MKTRESHPRRGASRAPVCVFYWPAKFAFVLCSDLAEEHGRWFSATVSVTPFTKHAGTGRAKFVVGSAVVSLLFSSDASIVSGRET